MTNAETQALRDQMMQVAHDSADLPPLSKLDVEIPHEAAQAARFLVELLLEE